MYKSITLFFIIIVFTFFESCSVVIANSTMHCSLLEMEITRHSIHGFPLIFIFILQHAKKWKKKN